MRPEQISVIIPLFNKRAEVGAAIASVLTQSVAPLEIVVVDDGSTDGSAEVVEAFTSPSVRLIRQPNGGVSAARNRAIREARGEWVALLDADDEWRPEFLERVSLLSLEYPECRAYGTGFDIRDGQGRLTRGDTPARRGTVDYFAEAMRRYVLIPSATVLHRQTLLALGGFPEGMRLGEDQYLWTRLARTSAVGFLPEALVVYSRAAQNRSAAIYRPEQTRHSFEDLYDPSATELSNEYVARVALGRALTISVKGGTDEARRAARFFAYTRMNRFALWKLRLMTMLPVRWRPAVASFYNRMAWRIARKGLD